MEQWRRALLPAFQQMLRPIQQQFELSPLRRFSLYPYLSLLPADRYIDIILAEVQLQIRDYVNPNMSLKAMFCRIGRRVIDLCSLELLKRSGQLETLRLVHDRYCRWLEAADEKNNQLPCLPLRHVWNQFLVEQLQKECEEQPLSTHLSLEQRSLTVCPLIINNIGQLLCRLMINHVRMSPSLTSMGRHTDRSIPCFYTAFIQDDMICKRVLRVHPTLLDGFNASCQQKLLFHVSELPMEVPPLPWSSTECGGQLLISMPFVRLKRANDMVQTRRIAQSPPQQMYPIYDSINQLGCMPWKINKPLLDVALKMFRNGGCDKVDLPPFPENLDACHENKDLRERALRVQERNNQFSIWSTVNYQLSVGNFFRDRVFFLPHTMDFRGRVYPSSHHVSHVTADLPRSFLMFARGLPLGSNGLRWLKIHLMNLTGRCKSMTNAERLEMCDKTIDDIMESADNPIHGRGWWRSSDDPWQTLAACMELTDALRSPRSGQFVSHLPVHQDGSCNGLQHYAALGRDPDGARSVNLAPSDRPQDIYSVVAAKVEELRAAKAAEGSAIAQKLAGCVERRVVKQTVMTTVYGVTMYGARGQIARQLKEFSQLTDEDIFNGTNFLCTTTFSVLKSMFSSARAIQVWLTECAKQVCKVKKCPIEWVTPLGLPVIQPYYVRAEHVQMLNSEGSALAVSSAGPRIPHAPKQRSALPPNYVHSLDSAHMMLTALHCFRESVTFVSVHDCFWTHAASVTAMNRLCRSEFVRLHNEPLLEQLSQQLKLKFAMRPMTKGAAGQIRLNRTLDNVPERSRFDLDSVLYSEYFFS